MLRSFNFCYFFFMGLYLVAVTNNNTRCNIWYRICLSQYRSARQGGNIFGWVVLLQTQLISCGNDAILFGILLPTLRRFCTLFWTARTWKDKREKFSETSANVCQTTRRNLQQDMNPKIYTDIPANSVEQRYKGDRHPPHVTTGVLISP